MGDKMDGSGVEVVRPAPVVMVTRKVRVHDASNQVVMAELESGTYRAGSLPQLRHMARTLAALISALEGLEG